MPEAWRVPDAASCGCRGECGTTHLGGTCAVPDDVPIRFRHEAAGTRWGWCTEPGRSGETRSTARGFGPKRTIRVVDGRCEGCAVAISDALTAEAQALDMGY